MRLLFLITLFSTYLLALISSPLHTSVTSVNEDKKELTIKTLPDTKLGMYGLVSHWFDDTHSVALSWIEITKIENENTTLKLIPIVELQQSALPSGTWKPKIGDEVVIGYNYQRALLIAPNASIYKKVTSYHTDRQWVHPDIFASVISTQGHPSPLKEDFSLACKRNNIGVVSFMFDKSIITVDCQSFKILQNRSTSVRSEDQNLPFYTRVPHIDANWLGEGSDEIKDYDAYYINLIAKYNPQNKWIQEYKKTREQAVAENKNDSWFGSFFDKYNVTIEHEEEEE